MDLFSGKMVGVGTEGAMEQGHDEALSARRVFIAADLKRRLARKFDEGRFVILRGDRVRFWVF